MTIEHTVRAFDADLQELAADIAEMGRLDDEQIALAIQALADRDEKLAERVVAGDDKIDSLQVKIEHKVVATIARRQPMAADLREIVAAFRISIELERIGDLAENVAKRVRLLLGEVDIPSAVLSLQRMVELVRAQLSDVLRSHADRNVELAMEVWNKDMEVDALNNAILRELLTYMMENHRNISLCTHLIFCAKDLERMGDHSTNIAETVFYMVQGRSVTEKRPKIESASPSVLPLAR